MAKITVFLVAKNTVLYITMHIKSLQAGMSRKDVYNTIVAKGFCGKQSAAYDYTNKIVDYYDIDISIGKISNFAFCQSKQVIILCHTLKIINATR